MPLPTDPGAQLVTSREKVLRWMFLPQLLVAFVFLGFAYWTGKDHYRLLRVGVHTEGQVVGFKPVVFRSSSNNSFSRTVNMPIIRFRAGDHITQFQEWKASRSDPGVGSSVPIFYDPSAPSIAMMDRGALNWLPWAPCAAIGLVLALAGLKGLLVLLTPSRTLPALGRA